MFFNRNCNLIADVSCRFVFASALLFCLIFSTSDIAEARRYVYQYADENGAVCFSTKPVKDYIKKIRIQEPPRPAATKKDHEKIIKCIRKASVKYGVDPDLAVAVARVESGFNCRAVSPKGAKGVMQLIPSTAAQYRVTDIFDVQQNITAGIRHLRYLMTLFNRNVRFVLAAYNAGEARVVRARGIPNIKETEQYVELVITHYRQYKNKPLQLYALHVPDWKKLEEKLGLSRKNYRRRSPVRKYVDESGMIILTNR